MKKAFEYFLNKLLKREIDLLFGENSTIVVNYIKYSTNNKSLTIDCKLLTTDPEMCIETYPVGLESLVLESWGWMGYQENIVLTHSIDLK
jgi:hypothetical protein